MKRQQGDGHWPRIPACPGPVRAREPRPWQLVDRDAEEGLHRAPGLLGMGVDVVALERGERGLLVAQVELLLDLVAGGLGQGVTRLCVMGVVLDMAGLLALGVWDFAATGNVNAYTLFIAGLVVYAVTAGKRDLKRLDAGMARRLTPRGRGSASSSPAPGGAVTDGLRGSPPSPAEAGRRARRS